MTRTALAASPLGFDNPGPGPDPGMPAEFTALFVIFAAIGIGTFLWRISLARRVAEQSGMDADQATEMVLLSDDGLDAAYLASSLRGTQPSAASQVQPEGHARRSAEERLREIQELHDQGLLTDEEYQARRKAVVDSL